MPDLFAPGVLIEPKVGARLSKVQQRFNTLLRKIEKLRAQLGEWRDTVPLAIERIRREREPLLRAYRELRIELVNLLDRAASERGMTKNERKKLRHLISSVTAELITEQPDESLEALHDKYSDVSAGEQRTIVNETIKSIIGDLYEIEIGDDVDVTDPRQLHDLAESLAQQAEDEDERRRSAGRRRTERGGSARAAAAETRRLTEEAQIEQSLRGVFRKLAGALHPDRATDEGERRRRTELMQRVNVAYEARDLLQLLELQLEAQLTGPTYIAELPDERLWHYVSMLEEQSAELERALEEAKMLIRLELDLGPSTPLSQRSVAVEAERAVRELRDRVAALRHDLALLTDRSRIKAWLRDYPLPADGPDLDELADVFFAPPVRKRRRRR